MSGLYESIPAAPEEVERLGKSLAPEHLRCRVWGHDPAPHNIVVAKDIEGVPGAHWDALLLCTHGCGVQWRVLVGRDGEVLRRRLDYSGAEGYLSEVGRIDSTGKKVLRARYFGTSVGTRRKKRGA